MGEPREYGPKGGTVLFLDLLAIFSPNLSEIEKNSVPALGTVLQGVPLIEPLFIHDASAGSQKRVLKLSERFQPSDTLWSPILQ